MSDLGRRVAVAAVGIPLVLGAIWLGGWVLGGVVAVAAALTVREFYALARSGGVRPFTAVGVPAVAGMVLLATWRPTPGEAAPLAAALLVLATLLSLGAAVWLRWPEGRPLASVSVTVLGVVYVGCALAFVPLLRWLPATAPGALTGNRWHATSFVLLPLLAIWAGDTVAYFVGRRWGRRKLAPAVSPGKTIEGAVGGLVGSSVMSVLLASWSLSTFPFLRVSAWQAAWIGLALGLVSQVGDLAESALKRESGVKDSGSLLPGHGGFLDRLDSLLFALPATWGLLLLAGVL